MGEAMCVGVLLMAGLAVAQPPAESSAGSAGTTMTAAVAPEQAGQQAGQVGAQAAEQAQPAPPTAGAGQTPPPGGAAGTVRVPATVPATVPTPGPADQSAQPMPSAPTAPPTISSGVRVAEPLPPARSRYLVQVMEGVLQSAVRYAAAQMNTKLQAVSPDLLQLSGAARARGFRLDGYGVFFDVEVPAALRQTMGWTARMMQQNDQTLDQAFLQLRRMATELDGKRRLDAETALRLVELRARPFLPRQYAPALVQTSAGPVQTSAGPTSGVQHPDGVQQTGAAVTATSAPAAIPAGMGDPSTTLASQTAVVQPGAPARPGPAVTDDAWMQNPDGAYENEVREALVNAMLHYGSTLALQPEEFLTVAARDNSSVVVPGDLTETVTVILRIRGRDLADLMAGRATEQDIRRRVEIREF